jgi:hypothetical protein
MDEVRQPATELCQAFDKLGIRYVIGGSLASSVHGIARATRDLDFIAAITPAQAKPLADTLNKSFYVDAEEVRSAIASNRSFNVIHLATAFKIDIFPASSHELGFQQLKRGQITEIPDVGNLPVISPEDTILVKLRWYRDGGETSERQWNDVRNIVLVQGARLDFAYLEEWARQLGVADLLETLLGP